MKYETELHLDFNNTMSIMINEITDHSCILEFGPASGRLTKYLKEKRHCNMYIVELDSEAAAIASKYAEQTVIGDIENYEWLKKFQDTRFDYILFADVLEHLYHPQQVLEKCKQLLKPNGYIMVSLPNIAHNSIIIDLLLDRFRYQNTGLLDNTHIRFWTMENIDKMFSELHLYIDLKTATYTQVGFNEIANSYEDIHNISPSALKTRKRGEVYQYVYKVTSNRNAANRNEICQYSDYYYIQWFMDQGQGFNDNNKERYTLTWDTFSQHYCINLDGHTAKVRLDPINASCMIRIHNLIATDLAEGQQFIQPESTNAASHFNDIYIFNEHQPIIVFETMNMKKITFDIDYLNIEAKTENMNLIYNELDNKRITIEQKDSYINELKGELTSTKSALVTAKKFLEKPIIKQLFYIFLRIQNKKKEDET